MSEPQSLGDLLRAKLGHPSQTATQASQARIDAQAAVAAAQAALDRVIAVENGAIFVYRAVIEFFDNGYDAGGYGIEWDGMYQSRARALEALITKANQNFGVDYAVEDDEVRSEGQDVSYHGYVQEIIVLP